MLNDNLVVLLLIGLLGLLYFPLRFFILLSQFKDLERRVRAMERNAAVAPLSIKAPAPKPTPEPEPSPLASSSSSESAPPPPLPPKRTEPPAATTPDPLLARLRDLGLLPPADLKGEYALGAWWTVRVGGVLAVAAAVFLGIWLNLRSSIPPIVRVLEVALVGAGLFWGGLRLSAKRADLGQVVAAAGLAVWQFAAWATYGLDKMRVLGSALEAAVAQFTVAMLIAVIALWKNSKLFGQLAVIFAVVAVFLSIGNGSAPAPTATGAGLVALLGVLLMVRGSWGSSGVLGLVGSQVCLLLLYDAMPAKDAHYLPLQLAAAGSFLVSWAGERLIEDDAVLLGPDARAAFQLAGFFAPACLCLLLANGGGDDRATVSLLLAAVAALGGALERGRRRLVSEVMLLAAVGFAGAGFAWLVDPHLVWLVWTLAAASTLVVGDRTRSELVRWGAEVFAGTAVFAFLDHPPVLPWVALAGVGAFALMLAYREDWERSGGWGEFRRILGIAGLAVVVLSLQARFPQVDNGWPWVVVLLVAAARFRPALLWAVAPGYLYSCFLVVFMVRLSGSWAAFWSALLALIAAAAIWRLAGREGDLAKALRHALAFLMAVVLFAFAQNLAVSLLRESGSLYPRSAMIATWSLGSVLLAAIASGLGRIGVSPSSLSLCALGAVFGFLIQAFAAGMAVSQSVGVAQAPLVLFGLLCLLHVLAFHTREQGSWGTLQRSCLGAAMLFLFSFDMLARLPGAGVSLFWALASVLTFVVGHLLATRSLRTLGLIGLGVASVRVLAHDITDLLGRIAACAAIAVAFFGIAWLYGRIKADGKDA